jgi:hypothetical protein
MANSLNIFEIRPAEMPPMLFDTLKQGSAAAHAYNTNTLNNAVTRRSEVAPDNNRQQSTTPDNIGFDEGRRDETLFRLANHLVKGGMDRASVEKYLYFIASKCNPPFPGKEIPAKIESAFKRSEIRYRNLTQEVREYILTTSGNFSTTNVYQVTTSDNREDRKKITVILGRMVKEGLIERVGDQNGIFRRIESDCEEMDWLNCETKTVPIWLPFGLDKMVEIMPGNIILVAGSPNAGKTAFLLNMIRYNMSKSQIHYFNSEMGSGELKKRLRKFDDIILRDWKFKAYERAGQFQDVIKSGEGNINIIDFLEIYEDFYEISKPLAEIHKKLKGAVAIVALQKNPGNDTGLGGYRTLEKPRLALSLDSGVLKIVKAKNWRTSENPNGKQIGFKLVDGCKLLPQGDWFKGN